MGHGNVNVSKQAALAAQLKQAQAAVEALQETMTKIQTKVEDPQKGLEVTAEKVAKSVGRKPQLALTRTGCTTDDKTGFCELNCNKSEYRVKPSIPTILGFADPRKLRDNIKKDRPKPQTPKEYFEERYEDLGDLRVLAEKVSSVEDSPSGVLQTFRNSKAVVRDDFETAGCYARQVEYCTKYGTRRGTGKYCKSKSTKYVKTKCTAVCAGAGFLKQ